LEGWKRGERKDMDEKQSFEEGAEKCLREWEAFIGLMQQEALAAKVESRAQFLEIVGVLRVKVASGLEKHQAMKQASGALRSSLRAQLEKCVADLQRTVDVKREQWRWHLSLESWGNMDRLVASMAVLLPHCQELGHSRQD
jgi:hypothetical protein